MPVSPSLLQSMQSGQPIATSPEARQFREDYGRAVRQVPRSILDYVTNTPANEMASDVGGLLGAMAQSARENPAEFIAGFNPYTGAMLSARDTQRTNEAIRQAEAQGDTRTADNLRQMNLLNMLGAVPVVGGFSNTFRNARRGLFDETVDTSRLPPASNAQRTQLGTSTIPTYSKANDMFTVEGKTLDYGAGRGLGAEQIGADTFEPFPMEGFNPTYNNSSAIPSNSYPRITSLNVLNVMPREARDEVVRDIGRILEPNGEAIITTRGRDVMSAQGVPQSEPMSIITSRDTYQKGFTQSELREYVQDTLGENFEVINAPQKIGAAGIVVRKLR